MTFNEALKHNVGFLQYLWYKAMKEVESKKAKQKRDEAALKKALDEEGG